jgi:hypothetical protein
MTTRSDTAGVRLQVENLEARELLSSGSWWVEPFQLSSPTGLPTNWSQWSNSDASLFTVDRAGQGLGGQGRLVSAARSFESSRAWLNTQFAANVDASAAVFLNSPAPVQLFARGQNLTTDKPTYYAVSITRGLELELLRVVNGTTQVLGRVKSTDWISNTWVQVRIRTEGDTIGAYVSRGETNQHLNAQGNWIRGTTPAIEVRDRGITAGGQVGFARPNRSSGEISLDSLRIGPAASTAQTTVREERFSSPPASTLPSGWSSWTNSPSTTQFQVRSDETLRIGSISTGEARVWLNQPASNNVQVSSSIYVDSLATAGIFARGSSVNTNQPTYYGVTIRRGLEIELVRVIRGQTQILGKLSTSGWQSGLWAQVSLITSGSELRVQVYRADTGQYLNANGTWGLAPAWALTRRDTSITSGGQVGLTRGTGSSTDLFFDNFLVTTPPTSLTSPSAIPTENDKSTTPTPPQVDPGPTPTPRPTPTPTPVPTPSPTPVNSALPPVPQSYSHIRVANLAYSGLRVTDYERQLLRESVDLVIPNTIFVDEFARVSPDTPQLIYTNVSNIYLGLLTDWLEYADRNRIDRESAFYHVTRATSFSGLSPSAVPVDHFWGVYRGNDSTGWANLTRDIRQTSRTTPFADVGQSLALGYTEKFREINVNLNRAASGSWLAELEYVRAVDAQGRPTAWGRLPLITDTTNGLRRSGQYTFDPPADWVTASIDGSARLYYIRLRTVNGNGVAPIARTILGRDYTRMSGLNGTIPAFDYQADRNNDGYLTDAEYARRRPGFDARFVYETRLTFPFYGPNRFATNVANTHFQNWVIDYHQRVARSMPLVSGFFVDNSTARLNVDQAGIKESLNNYAVDYGNLLGRLNRSLGSRWIVANTSGGGASVETQIRNGVSYLEEFALRPMTANHVQFEDLAALVRSRRELSGGKGYEILDSLPQNLDAADPRVMTTTLAMYYMIADPKLSMLMINGGNDPSSSWTRSWTDAIKFNVGQPLGNHTLRQTGQDPADSSLTYKVYQREYQNALVLYKPLSYTRGRTGTINNNTATTHVLNGTYRVVQANGTLGPPIRQITLRNGEGVVLAKA